MTKKAIISPDKAYKNQEFINSPEARLIRIQCELMEPDKRFREQNIHNTIVFFGSARTVPLETAETMLVAAEKALAENGDSPKLAEQKRVAQRAIKFAPFYEKTRQLAAQLSEWTLKEDNPAKQFHVITGGGPGIMEAANRGAFEAGGKSIGLGISLPFEQGLNPYCSPELGLEFHYFFIRKYWFLYHAKAIIVCPGGFGTLDELFEMLTLVQTKKISKKVPFILFGREFWESLINFDALIEWGTISESDLELFQIVDSVEEAYQVVTAHLSHCQWTPEHPEICIYPSAPQG